MHQSCDVAKKHTNRRGHGVTCYVNQLPVHTLQTLNRWKCVLCGWFISEINCKHSFGTPLESFVHNLMPNWFSLSAPPNYILLKLFEAKENKVLDCIKSTICSIWTLSVVLVSLFRADGLYENIANIKDRLLFIKNATEEKPAGSVPAPLSVTISNFQCGRVASCFWGYEGLETKLAAMQTNMY